MRRRILVIGAGTGASNNLIRSLKAGDPSFFIVGAHTDRFVLRKSSADRKYFMPAPDAPAFIRSVRRIVAAERIDLIIPTGDADVEALSEHRHRFPGRIFLPSRAIVDLCQDKYELTIFLRAHGVPAPDTYPVVDLERIEDLFGSLEGRVPLWCRARTGTRSLGAAPVTNPEQARGWIRYWEELRGVPASSFTLSEYLPGRDFLCQSIWRRGVLVLANSFERLAYFGGENTPSGVSSLSSLAKTVVDRRILDTCVSAIRALGRSVSGAFSVDLKEDRGGVPCVTEINAGRFFIGMTAFDHVGKHNMPHTYVKLALGEEVGFRGEYDAVEDYYLVRDLDTLPGVFHAAELFDGIKEVPA